MDRNKHGGGILIYIREDIPSRQLSKHNFNKHIEGMFIEINLRKTRWLLFGTYHPPSQSDKEYFEQVGLALDVYSDYGKFLLTGDFNAEDSESCLKDFLYHYDAKNLVKQKTCFKSVENPSCIDLFLTNSYRSFQNTTTVSTGLSDFHNMSVTVLKSTFTKTKPKEILYRDYRNFIENDFRDELRMKLERDEIKEYERFETIFLNVLNKHAPYKKKILRANQQPYITKTLRKAIMKRSELERKYYKNSSPENNKAYRKQKKFCSKLYKRERKKYYSNLDIKNITDNKKFWKTMKPFFSEKGVFSKNITLVNKDSIISSDQEVCETLNNYFESAVDSLDIIEHKDLITDSNHLIDPVEIAIKKFENHPSVLDINNNIKINSSFKFLEVAISDIELELKKLKSNKASTYKNIQAKQIKQTSDICSESLMKIWNNEIVRNKIFPKNLKVADITPIFKKEDSTLAKNYRPVSVLPVISKIFERIIQKQISDYIDKHLSQYLCGYRKG